MPNRRPFPGIRFLVLVFATCVLSPPVRGVYGGGHRMKKSGLLILLLMISACAGLRAQETPPNAGPVVFGHSVVALNGPWKFHIGDNPQWADPNYDDSAWQNYVLDVGHSPLSLEQVIESGELPGWQQHGHPGYTGYAWYRITLQTPPAAHALALLMPQYVDDGYEVFLDGQKIGSLGKLDGWRFTYPPQAKVFAIPAAALDSGQPALLAIRFWSLRYDALPSGHGLDGGLRGVPLLGPPELLGVFQQSVKEQTWKTLWPGWLLTALFGAVGIISLFLFLFSRSHREYLWAGISLTGIAVLVAFEAIAPATNIPVQLSDVMLPITDCIGYFALPLAAMHLLGVSRPIWRRVNYVVFAGILVHNLTLLCLYLGVLPPTVAMDRVNYISYLATLIAMALLLLAIAVDGLLTIGRKAWLPLTPGLLCACGLIALLIDPPVGSNEVGLYYYFFLSVPPAVLIIFLMRFTEQQRENVRLVDDMKQAQEVQQMLIPAEASSAPGFTVESVYLPAQQVGGDFFQVLPADDGSLLIVVGDVSGKGLKAAMTVSAIVGALRGCTLRAPAEVLAYLNRVLHGQISGFVTCCVALISEDGQLTIANAGHLSPYRNGEELTVDPGLPLGINGEAAYAEVTYRLSSNDRLTFISDGVVEARNVAGELYGFERTRKLSTQPAQVIAETARDFGQEDDITVLTLACTA